MTSSDMSRERDLSKRSENVIVDDNFLLVVQVFSCL